MDQKNIFKIKGQSQIVAAVVLVLIVIVLLVIILGFILPFVQNQIEGTDCFNADIQISESTVYNCFDDPDNEVHVQIHKGSDDKGVIEGFVVEIGGASSTTKRFHKDGVDDGVTLFNNVLPIELPGNNEERTYEISIPNLFTPEYIKVYPIITGGRTCEMSDELETVLPC